MTCQKTKSKLGNRRVRPGIAGIFKNIVAVFDCGSHDHSQIVRGRKIETTLLTFCSTKRGRYSVCSYLRMILCGISAIDSNRKYLRRSIWKRTSFSIAFESKQRSTNASHNAISRSR